MLAQLLEFINNLSIDEKLYWRVAGKKPGDGFEVFWRRGERPKPWSWRVKGEEALQSCTTGELIRALCDAGVDQADFERQLGVSVLTQAVFADMVMSAAKQLFGEDVVTKSIADTREFLSSVTKMAETHAAGGARSAPEPARPRLKLVTDRYH